ncbi:P-loop containing nucleoside triphosphate hydrolase protein [Cylindrobasidium torrendii FP15055 ss-10]|uniref:p-loop containing nucleoside triphosphate hydrolase protein n=1 Tax=Cylindrobasidium torrendii FP15055 ss-10 TaxID=1314674 RepID=A0A0D7BH81_9AGAR|nr:P-loop containing nucleoside triphosphate hydrolase protein [Cylindrobasidium torrendii FP15055 ss-10]
MSNSLHEITQHILNLFAARESADMPLFVALQGPQGSGKSYLTGLTKAALSSAPHSLRVVTASLDDFYLPHHGLVTLASEHPSNPLWRGRGQPGTHDIPLAITVLKALKENQPADVEIPVFEKSLHGGEGDRLPMTGNTARTPADVVILEGWCTGFCPISESELNKRWDGAWQDQKTALGLSDSIVGSKKSLEDVNAALYSYLEVWSYFDAFVQIAPSLVQDATDATSPYSVIYKWRLEQEHAMKLQNGGLGMSDDAVKLFVDRYIPGYVFFGDGVSSGYQDRDGVWRSPPWEGKGLRISINEGRELVSVEHM